MFQRALSLLTLPAKQSLFLWGARQTGKSSYLKAHFPNALYFDLLDSTLLVRYTQAPHLFRDELLKKPKEKLALPIIIDEVQKIPGLLNEVQLLITQHQLQFILCGSSARKLKKQSVNLLGGRAWIYHFYPLTFSEIENIDLLRVLQHGLLPVHYLASPKVIYKHLQAYIDIYLTDEIRNEGLVRNLAQFVRFLDAAGLCNGDLLNMSNIARDCHVSRTTVENYFQILQDTLIGYFIYPYHRKIKRDLVTAMPKFYFFDVGVAQYLSRRTVLTLMGENAGKAFEHYILMELMAYRGLKDKRFDINYWRTKTGLEVDFILGDAEIAIEVKISHQVHLQDLRGLLAFCEEHPQARAICVSQDMAARNTTTQANKVIEILPWHIFLTALWNGDIL